MAIIRRIMALARLSAQMRRWRLAVVMAATFGGLVLASTAAVLFVEWRLARELTIEFVNEAVQTSMEELERGVRERLDSTYAMVDDLAGLYVAGALAMGDQAGQELALRAAFAGRPDLSTIAVITPDFHLLLAKRSLDGTIGFTTERTAESADSQARYAATRERRSAFWGEVFFSEELRQPLINVRRAVFRGDELVGYLGAGLTVSEFSKLVDGLANEGNETPFILYGRDQVLAHPQLADLGERAWSTHALPGLGQIEDPVLAQVWAGQSLKTFNRSRKFGIDVSWVDDEQGGAIIAIKPLNGYGETPWTIGAWVPGTVLTQTLAPLRHGAFLGGGLLLVALALALVVGRLVAWPIRAATAGATNISTLALADVEPLPRSRIRELDDQSSAFNAMLTTIRAFETYVPRSVVQQLIRSGRTDVIRSTERDLTVMFTDIVGFTRIAELYPASRIAEFLNEHFALLARCVEDEGGTVDKFIGDGLMAFWGAPERLKQRAARACRAALAIREAIAEDNEERGKDGRPAIRLRIGLHRGPLIVGNIGSPGRINYTVVGDAANVAQRLEQLGSEVMGSDEIVILASDAVVADVGNAFRFERIGEMPIDGRNEPVVAFRLVAAATGETLATAENDARDAIETAAMAAAD